jgi:hypothetical protein
MTHSELNISPIPSPESKKRYWPTFTPLAWIRPFVFISWFMGIFWENLMSEGEKKKEKKTVLFIF